MTFRAGKSLKEVKAGACLLNHLDDFISLANEVQTWKQTRLFDTVGTVDCIDSDGFRRGDVDTRRMSHTD